MFLSTFKQLSSRFHWFPCCFGQMNGWKPPFPLLLFPLHYLVELMSSCLFYFHFFQSMYGCFPSYYSFQNIFFFLCIECVMMKTDMVFNVGMSSRHTMGSFSMPLGALSVGLYVLSMIKGIYTARTLEVKSCSSMHTKGEDTRNFGSPVQRGIKLSSTPSVAILH